MGRLTLVGTTAALLTATSALDMRGLPGAVQGPGYVQVPVTHKREEHMLYRRAIAGTGATEMPNYSGAYTIDVLLGEPGQKTSVILDTGSHELWVNPDCTRASMIPPSSGNDGVVYVDGPLTDPKQCEARGRYDPSKSSSRKSANMQSKTFQYAGYTTVSVDYVQDKLSIAGLTIQDQIFGVATASNTTGVGILGMGPSPFGFNNSGFYPLILTNMAKQGAIKSAAFSLDLRNYNNATGSILFGGVDKGKYSGSLAKIPFLGLELETSNGQKVTHFSYYLEVKSMKLAKPGEKNFGSAYQGSNYKTSLDTGTSSILLPNGMAAAICKDLNGTPIPNSGGSCTVDCSMRLKEGGLKFELAGKDITVGYDNLISQQDFQGQPSTCIADIGDINSIASVPAYILGAPFIRAAYAVFDWGNSNLHIAQSANCGSNIVAIGAGENSVPTGNGDCSFASNSIVVNSALMMVAALFSGLMLF